MAMEKEALTNTIESDLAKRNRNWDKVDGHLAEFAQHKHDGQETLKISWGAIDGKPVLPIRTYNTWQSAGATYNFGDIENGIYLAYTDRSSAGGAVWVVFHSVKAVHKLYGTGQNGTLAYSGSELRFTADSGGGEGCGLYKLV